jgi:hypothetical protein
VLLEGRLKPQPVGGPGLMKFPKFAGCSAGGVHHGGAVRRSSKTSEKDGSGLVKLVKSVAERSGPHHKVAARTKVE